MCILRACVYKYTHAHIYIYNLEISIEFINVPALVLPLD